MSSVKFFIKHNNINPDTISFYTDGDDTEFTVCDVTGQAGDCARCTALDMDGNTIEFDALDSIVGGELGRIAGAF